MRRTSPRLFATAVGIVGLVSTAAAVPAFSTTHAAAAPRVITYQEPKPKVAEDDIAPTSSSTLSLGDRLAIGGILESSNHRRLGTFGGSCVVVGTGRSFVTTPLLCQAVYRTAGGQIEAVGLMTLSKTELVIVGGSGAYAGAHGSVSPGAVAKGFEDADKLTIEP